MLYLVCFWKVKLAIGTEITFASVTLPFETVRSHAVADVIFGAYLVLQQQFARPRYYYSSFYHRQNYFI